MAERTAWRSCSDNGWFSRFGQKPRRGKGTKVGPPVHDDLVRRVFAADAPNRLWLGDITEHQTGEGKVYLCEIKDVFSNRIVGYCIDSRMKARLAVAANNNAAARRGDVARCILHTDRGSQFRARKAQRALNLQRMVGSMGRVGAAGDNGARESFSARRRRTSWTDTPGEPARSCAWRSSPGSTGRTTAADKSRSDD
jgi:putative transposase